MSYALNLTQDNILTSLRAVLLLALPAGVEVVEGQINRVAEPQSVDFVVMQPILRSRIELNTDLYEDVLFTGSISTTVLTVANVTFGTIELNSTLFGTSVAAGTIITAQTSGTTGGAGVYTVSVSQTLASQPLAAGQIGMLAPTQVTIQLDVHGPASGDNVQILSTLLRSAYGYDLLQAQGYDISPLYTSDPREMPFVDGEQQVEFVWSIDAVLQANQIVAVPQQFAGAATVTLDQIPA